jgi:hypothetical protein
VGFAPTGKRRLVTAHTRNGHSGSTIYGANPNDPRRFLSFGRSDTRPGDTSIPLPAFTRRTVSLPNHPRMLRELRLLERQVHAGGRDTVDHGRNGSDDLANCVFGCLYYVQKRRPRLRVGMMTGADGFGRVAWLDDPPPRTRIKIVHLKESEAPAARGWS